MGVIKLSRGREAIVDDADYDLVNQHIWYAYFNNGIWYAATYIDHKQVLMHRFLMPGVALVDHINGDGLDNRRCNLRASTKSQNMANSPKRANPTSSRFKGVSRDKNSGKFRAYIYKDGKQITLGSFEPDQEEDAARAYDAKAKELYQEHAYLNFPME